MRVAASLHRAFLLAAALGCGLATPAPARALVVTATAPVPNAMAPATTVVRVDFDRPVDPTSVSAATVRVFGRASGTAAGTLSLANGNRSVTLTPARPFSAGETVLVNLAHALTAADLSPLRSAGFAFQFTVATAPSGRVFTPIDTFSNRPSPEVQTRIYGAQATDLNGDGWIDLATVNEMSSDVRVALNRGDGSGLFQPFLPPQPIGLEASPNEPADFDNDGHTDGCFAAADGQSITVLLGNGDGTYKSTQTIALTGTPRGIAVLDLDGDADLDIANANRANDDLTFLLNDGHGVFGAPISVESGVDGEYGLAAGDMNRDGITDLVVAGRDSQSVVTFLANGDGTFTPKFPARASGGTTWVVQLGDLNGDGHLDAATANAGSGTGAVLLAVGDGTFGTPAVTTIGAHTPSTDLGDLDGDGDLDWLLSSFGAGVWRVYVNDGDGGFTFDQQFTAASNPSCAIPLDFDNDGDLDLALTDEIADVIVLQRNGGVPAPTPTPLCAASPVPCRTPVASGKATIALRHEPIRTHRDALRFTWTKGSATSLADFGDPRATTTYELCVYDAGALVLRAVVPPGGVCPTRPCWTARRKGFDYADRDRTPDGIAAIQLRAGADGRARVVVAGKGVALPMPSLAALTGPLDVQLHAAGGACWGARFGAPFRTRGPAKLADRAD